MRGLGGVTSVVLVSALVAASAFGSSGPTSGNGGASLAWVEHFDHATTLGTGSWVDPFDHSPQQLARIYTIGHETRKDGSFTFLHAHHDASVRGAAPSYDLGHPFEKNPPPLERVKSLSWKWRVNRQPPAPADDPWLDMAASIYVVMKVPSLFKSGKGFKFGWVARPAPTGTYQHGLLQIPLRADPAGPEWKSESVDLCALYRKEYGPCEGQHLLYVGVVTDADGTKSIADGDYADFQVEMVSP